MGVNCMGCSEECKKEGGAKGQADKSLRKFCHGLIIEAKGTEC